MTLKRLLKLASVAFDGCACIQIFCKSAGLFALALRVRRIAGSRTSCSVAFHIFLDRRGNQLVSVSSSFESLALEKPLMSLSLQKLPTNAGWPAMCFLRGQASVPQKVTFARRNEYGRWPAHCLQKFYLTVLICWSTTTTTEPRAKAIFDQVCDDVTSACFESIWLLLMGAGPV
jgi:hypothetical protein